MRCTPGVINVTREQFVATLREMRAVRDAVISKRQDAISQVAAIRADYLAHRTANPKTYKYLARQAVAKSHGVAVSYVEEVTRGM